MSPMQTAKRWWAGVLNNDRLESKNWLPINRKDEDLSVNLRIYVPDQEKMKTGQEPKAERISK